MKTPASNEPAHDGDKPGTERHRDEQRPDHGPVYHGGDWKDADDEPDREALRTSAEDEGRSDVEAADEDLTEPGTRGANFGRGGKGIVERDEDPDEGAKPRR